MCTLISKLIVVFNDLQYRSACTYIIVKFKEEVCRLCVHIYLFVYSVFTTEELESALRPVFNAVWNQETESFPFRQPVNPSLLGIPVSVCVCVCVCVCGECDGNCKSRSRLVSFRKYNHVSDYYNTLFVCL